jgi:hypothetical protein
LAANSTSAIQRGPSGVIASSTSVTPRSVTPESRRAARPRQTMPATSRRPSGTRTSAPWFERTFAAVVEHAGEAGVLRRIDHDLGDARQSLGTPGALHDLRSIT